MAGFFENGNKLLGSITAEKIFTTWTTPTYSSYYSDERWDDYEV